MQKKEINHQYFDVRVEAMVPAIIHYRVYASSPEEAAKKIERASVNSIQYKIANRKNIKLLVFEAGQTMLKFMKNFVY